MTAPYLIADQSDRKDGYRKADYMTSDPQSLPATVATPLSATLLHQTVEHRITITRGNTGWFSSSANDEEKEAANNVFLALFSTGDVPTEAIHVATTSDSNDPSKLTYNAHPCLSTGVLFGYTFTLGHPRWSADASIGAGYIHRHYDRYT